MNQSFLLLTKHNLKMTLNDRNQGKIKRLECMEHLVSPFFQNIVRQPIKLYDINVFSATKKEKV